MKETNYIVYFDKHRNQSVPVTAFDPRAAVIKACAQRISEGKTFTPHFVFEPEMEVEYQVNFAMSLCLL